MISRFWHHKVDYTKNNLGIDLLVKISLEQGVKIRVFSLTQIFDRISA